MAINAFISFFDKADGESIQKGREKWVELLGWDWEVEAESSWTKGGGAAVGKPNPGTLTFQHGFDTASIVILGYICSGKAFPKVQLEMVKASARGIPETFFTVMLEGVLVTKASQGTTEEGAIVQQVELAFKSIKIEYKPQDRAGGLGTAKVFNWDIPSGTASPSA